MKVQDEFFSILPKLLGALLLLSITVYTYHEFADQTSLESLLIYFIPSFLLFFLLALSSHFERFGGLSLILASFGFLLIYHVFISISVFLLLIGIGSLFLIDNSHHHQRIRF